MVVLPFRSIGAWREILPHGLNFHMRPEVHFKDCHNIFLKLFVLIKQITPTDGYFTVQFPTHPKNATAATLINERVTVNLYR